MRHVIKTSLEKVIKRLEKWSRGIKQESAYRADLVGNPGLAQLVEQQGHKMSKADRNELKRAWRATEFECSRCGHHQALFTSRKQNVYRVVCISCHQIVTVETRNFLGMIPWVSGVCADQPPQRSGLLT